MKTALSFLCLLTFCMSGCSASTSPTASKNVPNSWTSVSAVGFTSRMGLTASEVGGRIYAIGGVDIMGKNQTPLSTLEIFDPSSNTWSTPITTGTFTARRSHSASVVDGNVYVIGGVDDTAHGTIMQTVQVFDPSTNSWSTRATTGTFTPRFGHTASVIGGKIYIIGGEDGPVVTSIDVFDPATNSWNSPVTTGSFVPSEFLASSVVNGKIVAMGGFGGSNLSSVGVFDPQMKTWSIPPAIGTFTERYGLTSDVVNGKIYAFGGAGKTVLNTLEMFDPSTNTWITPSTTGTSSVRAMHASCVVGGKIYVMGGTVINTVEVFTPAP